MNFGNIVRGVIVVTTKEYLEQITGIDDRIASVRRRIEEQVRLKEDTLSAMDYSKDRVSGGGGNQDLSGVIAGIESYIDMQQREIQRLQAIKEDVTDTIYRVSSNELVLLLIERYAHNKTWKEVTELLRKCDMGLMYNEVRVRGGLHTLALEEVEKIRRYKTVQKVTSEHGIL